MKDKKEIGRLIKQAREIKSQNMDMKYTGQMLADDLGISRGFLGDIESGRKNAPEALLNKIIQICGLGKTFFEAASNYTIDNDLIPNEFINPIDARAYVSKHQIFASEGFKLNKMTDDDVLKLANEMLHYAEFLKTKYNK